MKNRIKQFKENNLEENLEEKFGTGEKIGLVSGIVGAVPSAIIASAYFDALMNKAGYQLEEIPGAHGEEIYVAEAAYYRDMTQKEYFISGTANFVRYPLFFLPIFLTPVLLYLAGKKVDIVIGKIKNKFKRIKWHLM